MANLNPHDIVFLHSMEFKGFKEKLEDEYNFKILSTSLPDIISFTSKKLILTTSAGKFFLKEKPQYCSDELSLLRSANFQSYIASQLEIVPKIVTTRGQDYYVTWNRKHYFLTEYKKGRHYNGSQKDIDMMIEALCRFQECGATYFRIYKESRSNELTRFESFDIASSIHDLENQIKSQNERAIFNEILSLYENLCSEYSALPKGAYTMSHSDFILFNLILDKSGVVAINDFDNAKVLPRVHDMAEFLVSAALLNYIAPLTNLKLPISISPDGAIFARIMDQYVNRLILSNDDITLLGSVAEIVWLWTLVLAVLKEDYSLSDLNPAISVLRSRKLKSSIEFFVRDQCAII